jgi:hypothetical protein
MSSFFNTDTKSHEAPTPDTNNTRADTWTDPKIDTKAEARMYQDRLDRLAKESADPYTSPVRRRVIQAEKANLERALPHQVAIWREIDARRAARGNR